MTSTKLVLAKKKLPVALAARNALEKADKLAVHLRDVRADVSLVKRRISEISDAFYDVGLALTRIKMPGALAALGRSNFAEACARDLGLSLTVAEQLITIVASFDRDTAISLRQDRAAALVDLSRALPGKPAPATLVKTRLRLPDGSRVRASDATASAIREVAKEARRANGPAKRGRTTTAAERSVASDVQTRLRAAGFAHATVTAVATKPGQPADARIEHVPVAQLAKVGKSLAASRPAHGVRTR